MHDFKRLLILLAACGTLTGTPAAHAADENDFNGAWIAWICPSGASRDLGKCANFVIELIQKDNKLCGTHVFATPGASQMDEGDAASLTGEIAGNTASVVVLSSRVSPPLRVSGELKLTKSNRLQWRRLENPSGDHLLPESAAFTKSRSKTLRTAAFERDLQLACAAQLTPPPPKEAPPEPALRPIPTDRIEQTK
ncbi:MAG TPA: hypothetical protein VGU61_16425 [Noviherbaspirillum sp.]|jgi:hypothetical protein|uniref:hypothetical protein n=1 Tax=Noviherbaspirillum sp. TaxID=1926288 RepID=UPI002DDCB04E|nr:hypothetical protein [Noviherbaspirillum sp.]HEV2611854.1 hypothetical protein [Noviherbaspirillum sp.]